MTEIFERYLHEHARLNEEEMGMIISKAETRTLRRGEALLQQGQVCRHKIFIEKGLLRMAGTSADGSEHIVQFSPENTWTLEVESYDRQQPAQFSIAAVENSEILMWHKTDFEYLLAHIPALKVYSQQLISRNIYTSRQRIITAISATPEEKYEQFIQEYPQLLARVPLHMIASYLGISLKTLTRIRQAQLHR